MVHCALALCAPSRPPLNVGTAVVPLVAPGVVLSVVGGLYERMAIRHVDCVGSMATRWPGAAAVGVAMKTRRPTKTTKVKHRKGATAARRRASSAINLQKQLDQRTRERDEARKYLSAAQRHLAEALERQTATTEVLQVISRSPGELDTVFRLILENATRICEAKFGNLYLCDGDGFRMVASHNDPPASVEGRRRALWR